MLTYIRRPLTGGAVVTVEGSFDAADADQLGSIASALDAGGSVTLDFHEARSAGDMAIVRLARGILEAPGHVSMVGLSEHHHRLLTYIGLEPAHIKHGDLGAVTEFSRQREQALVGEGEAERLGYLTHELRNLLSTAMLSQAAIKSGRVAVGGRTGAILDRSLMGMRDLLETTIAGVRLSAGSPATVRISIAVFLQQVEGAASLQAAERQMELNFAIPAVDAVVNADPHLLASAFFNLLQNAFKYSIPHGHVAVRTICGDERVTIEVEDECGGLPDKDTEALFSPFGERRGKDRSGLGLGLSISRKAVKAFGGDIRVRNLPGKGCIFTIELPVAATA